MKYGHIMSYHVISSFFPMFHGKPRVFFFFNRVPYSINRFIIVLPIEIDIRGIPHDVSNKPKTVLLGYTSHYIPIVDGQSH